VKGGTESNWCGREYNKLVGFQYEDEYIFFRCTYQLLTNVLYNLFTWQLTSKPPQIIYTDLLNIQINVVFMDSKISCKNLLFN
jgi:hypothetical protein